jgi:hypothetical protein
MLRAIVLALTLASASAFAPAAQPRASMAVKGSVFEEYGKPIYDGRII